MVVSVFVSIFYMASLNIFLIAMQCSPGGTVSGDVGAASARVWRAVLAPPPGASGGMSSGGSAESGGAHRRLLGLKVPEGGVPFPTSQWIHLIYAKG